MPHHYRAPEAILNMEWNDKVDIWNIAVLLWDLVSPGHLFGKWKNLTPIPDITLESLAIDVQGEDKEGFLSFLRKILRWVPEERPTAGELVESSSTEGQKQWKYHKTFIQCKDETGTS
ncbi:predicted protein [Histoplasma mississippiense (nom. inval.)]|uniref:predicted protein n=1 Tax=Ajellomyces capsulatus (strain NAm1 / WU24) TaxID=2059318 RepID=UPI000157C31E|nr:predicted protein [Histoplasma mississippiense (nom. inval.)]EDN07679.1 predicted protein [Histoplasma mississippiense (nom. inval.)]